MARRTKSVEHYVDNKKLYTEMVKYLTALNEAKANDKTLPRVSPYIGESIYKIANRLALSPKFYGYSYREEMISDGIENCLMYLHNFNPDKYNNPFAYFTQIIWFAFLRRIQREQKQQYIKHKLAQNSMIMNTLVDHAQGEDSQFTSQLVDDYLNSSTVEKLMEKFDKKPTKKKKKGIENFVGEDNEE